jgi:2-oxoglutarate ferredoxin oxidoreductase subunit delta
LNVCPKKVFDLDENYEVVVKNVDECIGCRLCENLCPDFAIEVEEL